MEIEKFGIETEYMIVDRNLNILPIADELLKTNSGMVESSLENGPITWSNELVLHLIELKTTHPETKLSGLDKKFHHDIKLINKKLEKSGAMLMPTAMHPSMNPLEETKIWPYENSQVYFKFNEIFNCRGHGWSNLQSMHINLPFKNGEEFMLLHSAIRTVIPIIPAISASSPIYGNKIRKNKDNRLLFYRDNCKRIPSVTGKVVPENIKSIEEYKKKILGKIYKDISPFDGKGILAKEWINARGAIARFERDTIEIRVIDVQECPKSDIALAYAVMGAVKNLANGKYSPPEEQLKIRTDALAEILESVIKDAEDAMIKDKKYLSLFGVEKPLKAGELWKILAKDLPRSEYSKTLGLILDRGSLSTRISENIKKKKDISGVYRELCSCLELNRPYTG